MTDVVQIFTSLKNGYPVYVCILAIISIIGFSEGIKCGCDFVFMEKIPVKIRSVILMTIPYAVAFGVVGLLTIAEFEYSVEAALSFGTSAQIIYRFVKKILARAEKQQEEITESEIKSDIAEAKQESNSLEQTLNKIVGKYVDKDK